MHRAIPVSVHPRVLSNAALWFGVFLFAACDSPATEPSPSGMDGSTIDGSLQDASAAQNPSDASPANTDAQSGSSDASEPAAVDADGRCYTPLNLPIDGGPLDPIPGCHCPEPMRDFSDNTPSYCIGSHRATCSYGGTQGSSQWILDDRACGAQPELLDYCFSNRIVPLSAAQDASCPSGFSEQGVVSTADAGSELSLCCQPIFLLESNCTQAGLVLDEQGSPYSTRMA